MIRRFPPSAAAPSGYDTVQDEGVAITQRAKVNFIGATVTAADDSVNTRTNVTLDAVPTSRTITTSTGLSGGGDLSADRTLTVTADSTVQKVAARLNSTGSDTGTRRRINFIEGQDIGLTLSDDSGDNELDLTIATVTVKDYGAVGDGSTDDTAAIQSALNAIPVVGASGLTRVFFPRGVYKITGELTISNGAIIQGAGQSGTIIRTNHSTAHMFNCSTQERLRFADLRLDGATLVTKTGGSGIRLTSAAGSGTASPIIERCAIIGFNRNIDLVASGLAVIRDNYIVTPIANGVQIYIENTLSPDSGDHQIYGNVIDAGAVTTAIGIDQKSSGGVKFFGNKVLGGAVGYRLDFQADTSILLIHSNSIENQSSYGIHLTSSTVGPGFSQVSILGNQMASTLSTHAIYTDVTGGVNPYMLILIDISHNLIYLAANKTGINLTAGDIGNISDNIFVGDTGNTAISIGANATNWNVGANVYRSIATPLSVSAASSGNYTFMGDVGIGTVSVAASALLDLTSTTKALVIPRMTTTQRDAISTPIAGMLVYNTSTAVVNFYNGSAWGAV